MVSAYSLPHYATQQQIPCLQPLVQVKWNPLWRTTPHLYAVEMVCSPPRNNSRDDNGNPVQPSFDAEVKPGDTMDGVVTVWKRA